VETGFLRTGSAGAVNRIRKERPVEVKGRVWYIREDNIDTDMIFHNRYLAITDIKEMGQYTFDNLKGYQDFAKKRRKAISSWFKRTLAAGHRGSRRLIAFLSLGHPVHYGRKLSGPFMSEMPSMRHFPIITYPPSNHWNSERDEIRVNYETGVITNLKTNISLQAEPFSEVQLGYL
jgi:3-isopropylmalate/(R)-2-methylmalate dehydratase large subunit